MIALSPGAHAAQQAVCRPPPRTTRMDGSVAVRKDYGLRHDRAYIRRLIARGLVFMVDVQRFR